MPFSDTDRRVLRPGRLRRLRRRPAVGRAGTVEVIHPSVPAPPSPSVAAFYVALRNSGPIADTLIGAFARGGAVSFAAPVVALASMGSR